MVVFFFVVSLPPKFVSCFLRKTTRRKCKKENAELEHMRGTEFSYGMINSMIPWQFWERLSQFLWNSCLWTVRPWLLFLWLSYFSKQELCVIIPTCPLYALTRRYPYLVQRKTEGRQWN